jgi:hypothetical protein
MPPLIESCLLSFLSPNSKIPLRLSLGLKTQIGPSSRRTHYPIKIPLFMNFGKLK